MERIEALKVAVDTLRRKVLRGESTEESNRALLVLEEWLEEMEKQ